MAKLELKLRVQELRKRGESIKQIAKKVGMSREVVNYRINQLVKKGIIKDEFIKI